MRNLLVSLKKIYKNLTKDTGMYSEVQREIDEQEVEVQGEYEEDSSQVLLVSPIPRDKQRQIRGTKLQFFERLDYNLGLIRERIPDKNLIFEKFVVGSRGKRVVVIAYLKDLAHPGIVKEVKQRIKQIKAETVLDSSYIERNIENSRLSPFPQFEHTLRPDMAELALFKGKVLILTAENPEVLMAPTTFFDLMDAPEDLFGRWFVAASFFRIARFIMFLLAATLPGFYIALTSYNPDLIPTKLAFLIASANEGTPFPIYFEAFLMMGVVEAVRMIMIRFPNEMGSTIALFAGVVLVIAGLHANIIGAPIVIIVTLTIITSFGIPSFDLRLSVRITQFFTMIMATVLGLFGYAIAFFYIAIHLVTLKSFGIPYMSPFAPIEGSGWGHDILREDIKAMPLDETYKASTKNLEKEKGEN